MRIVISISFLVFLSLSSFSQNATVRGFVYDQDSKEPVMFCNVFLLEIISNDGLEEGITAGSATDENGMYIIRGIKAGKYKLTATYIGYDTVHQNIILKNKEILNKDLEIKESSIKLGEVKISAERAAMKTEVKVGAIKVTKKDLKLIPTIGGESDLAQYMQ
ncbi:MAG: carboxypeptidase-like regulatory domain-containing protein, partial [Bacteroidota bacterium]|nr:carboxypeptidase-like regulatory domain-containing protein [Bacteroidota bacterium]